MRSSQTATHGWLRGLVEAGRQPRARVTDLLIAATVHAHGAALYTRNADDLASLEDLLPIVPDLSASLPRPTAPDCGPPRPSRRGCDRARRRLATPVAVRTTLGRYGARHGGN